MNFSLFRVACVICFAKLATGCSTGSPDGSPAPAPACSRSADCDRGRVCAYVSAGDARCVVGSGTACDTLPATDPAAPPTCYAAGNLAFNYHEAIGCVTPPCPDAPTATRSCATSVDCRTMEGHLLGACIDAVGDGSSKVCVPLCQYPDDSQRYACVTDGTLGLRENCSRDHARIAAAASVVISCGGGAVRNWGCARPAVTVDADMEWTVNCLLGHVQDRTPSCEAILLSARGCFNSRYNPEARFQELGPFLDRVETNLTLEIESTSGGTRSPSSQCRTDCDCGHCNYCEVSGGAGVCRFGGEGPYGCYRGCD